MSEPVSNAEIEDVLSSIRRLVSENAENNRAKAPESATVEKLVLTPAFRVLSGTDDESHDEGEAGETLQEEPVEAVLEEADREDASPQEPFNQDEPVAQQEPVHEVESASYEDSSVGLEQKIAELEAAIEGTYEEWEPDGSEEESASAEPFVIQQATPAHEGTETPREEGVVVEGRAEEVSEEPAETEKASEPEKVEAQAQPERDEVEEQDDEAGYLDEDSLRELVIQLVREELQGHVGERITRSVRRMVRREIKRVMALHELE